MTMSVGLGRIIPDPEASLRTRQALAILSDPNRIVNDKGLTIDDEGRLTLRVKNGGGVTEDENGLAVLIKPDGGLTVDATGISAKLKPDGGISVDEDGLSVIPPDLVFPWTRFLTATATLSVGTGATADYDIAVPGAIVGDCAVVSPSTAPTFSVGGWSAVVVVPNFVRVRISVGDGTASPTSVQFRVIVIGVT